MKEKIKEICFIILYVFIWLIFIFSSFGIFVGLSEIKDIRKWGFFLMFSTVPLLSIYLLRHHFRFLKNKLVSLIKWSWEKENLYKLAVVIIVISILIMAISFIR